MKPQLSVRSAKARELAHRLARSERRTVAHGGSLATRNLDGFRHAGIDLVNPWQTTAVQER